MKRLTSLLLSATLIGALTVVAATPAGATCAASAGVRRADVYRQMKRGAALDAGVARANAAEGVSLLTFNLDVAKFKSVYKIGDVVDVDVTVTRPAKEDPLGNGVPMDRPYVEPAPEVIVGVGLHIGRVFLPGAAMTDAEGRARIRIKLENYAPKGETANVSMYAWKIAFESTCATVQEYGYRTMMAAFKTAP